MIIKRIASPDSTTRRLSPLLLSLLAIPALTRTPATAARFAPAAIVPDVPGILALGTVSGLIYSASTVGSIGGVFVSGYYFIDNLSVPAIFRDTGLVCLFLAGLSLAMDRWLGAAGTDK